MYRVAKKRQNATSHLNYQGLVAPRRRESQDARAVLQKAMVAFDKVAANDEMMRWWKCAASFVLSSRRCQPTLSPRSASADEPMRIV